MGIIFIRHYRISCDTPRCPESEEITGYDNKSIALREVCGTGRFSQYGNLVYCKDCRQRFAVSLNGDDALSETENEK